MVVLPLVKLGALALGTLSKPIASKLKKAASVAPSANLKRRLYGHAANVEVRPLNEERAVQTAADLIGEVFIFTDHTFS